MQIFSAAFFIVFIPSRFQTLKLSAATGQSVSEEFDYFQPKLGLSLRGQLSFPSSFLPPLLLNCFHNMDASGICLVLLETFP